VSGERERFSVSREEGETVGEEYDRWARVGREREEEGSAGFFSG
jgi:hypothetical protein